MRVVVAVCTAHGQLVVAQTSVDPNRIQRALGVVLMRRIDGHPKRRDVLCKAFEPGSLLADSILDGIGMIDAVERDLKLVFHRLMRSKSRAGESEAVSPICPAWAHGRATI